MTTRFKHSCELCVFLGHLDQTDIYWCPRHGSKEQTIVWRWSDDNQMQMRVVVAEYVIANQELERPAGAPVVDPVEEEYADQLRRRLLFALQRIRALGLEAAPS